MVIVRQLAHADWIFHRWNRYTARLTDSREQHMRRWHESYWGIDREVWGSILRHVLICHCRYRNMFQYNKSLNTWRGEFCCVMSLITYNIYSKNTFQCWYQTKTNTCQIMWSPGSSNIAIWSYHKMDIASLSGAVYGVGSAQPLCMGLFWAGLSLSLDSIYRSLAAGHCSAQSHRQTPLPPPTTTTAQHPPLLQGNR